MNMEKLTLLPSMLLLVNFVAVQISSISAQQIGGNDTTVEDFDTNNSSASCHLPAHSNFSRIEQNPNEDMIMIEGRCYLACAKKVSDSLSVSTLANIIIVVYHLVV